MASPLVLSAQSLGFHAVPIIGFYGVSLLGNDVVSFLGYCVYYSIYCGNLLIQEKIQRYPLRKRGLAWT